MPKIKMLTGKTQNFDIHDSIFDILFFNLE